MSLCVKKVIVIDTPVEQDKMAKRLRVVKKGIQAGRDNLPTSSATEPDAHEVGIVQAFRTLWHRTTTWFSRQLKHEQDQQVQYTEQCDAGRFAACCQTAEQSLATLDATSRDPLIASRKQERQAAQDMRAFRHGCGLTREAVYPASRLWHLAVLAVMVLVESMANAHFFAQGSPYGLLGGLLEAMIVAGVNVAMAFHVGIALRGVNGSGMQRVMASLLGVVYVVVLGLYHLAVGHYRTALVNGDAEGAASAAIVSLLHDPMSLTDIHSWLLILVGVLFAIGAVVAGYTADDRVLGYGAVTRRFKDAEVAYQQRKDQYLMDIQVVIDTQLEAVDICCAEAKTAMVAYRASVAESQRLIRNYREVCHALAETCMALQRRYRAANEAVRDTPAPAFYAEEPPRPFEPDESIALELATVAAAEQITSDFKQEVQLLHEQAAEAKHRLYTLYQAHLDKVPAYFVQIEALIDAPTPDHAMLITRAALLTESLEEEDSHHV